MALREEISGAYVGRDCGDHLGAKQAAIRFADLNRPHSIPASRLNLLVAVPTPVPRSIRANL